jgi:competence protein ComEA
MTCPVIVRALALALVTALCLGAAPAAAEKNASASSTSSAASAPSTTAAPSATASTSSTSASSASARTGTVNINTGSAAEIGRLPRVGAKLADRIVTHRTQHGPFKRVEDLMEVKGVGEKMFVSLKPYLSVAGQTTLAAKVGGSSRGAKVSPASNRGSGGKARR